MITREEWDSYTDEEKWHFVRYGEQDLEGYKKILERIPECPAHGFCKPHMWDWITRALECVKDVEQREAEIKASVKRFVLPGLNGSIVDVTSTSDMR